MNEGQVGILNVGAGDTKLSFDKSNMQERIRAARIVRDMIRRGYVLLVDVGDGKFQRAMDFDEEKCEYIIADLDPLAAEAVDNAEMVNGASSETEKNDATSGRKNGRKNAGRKGKPLGPYKKRKVEADKTRAVAVGRTAGG